MLFENDCCLKKSNCFKSRLLFFATFQAVDDLDAYVRWLAKQEKAFQASKKILENPGDLVTACQWLAKVKVSHTNLKQPESLSILFRSMVSIIQHSLSFQEKTLKEEYLRREKVVKTAVELCGESEEVQSIHKRSMQLLKAIDLYIVKVSAPKSVSTMVVE